MIFSFDVPIYNCTVRVHHTQDLSELEEEYPDVSEHVSHAMCICCGREFELVFVDEEIESSMVAHELFHLTSGILRHAGILLDENSEEAYAYLYGFVYKQVMCGLYSDKS